MLTRDLFVQLLLLTRQNECGICCIILSADLEACSPVNLILNYADDTNLLVPQCSDTSILDEFEAIRNWTRLNKMQLIVKETKELVFHRPNPRFSLPDPLPHIEHVNGLKLLGVFLNARFKFAEYVNKTLCLCSQRMYLLKQLKSQGLGIKQLHIVFTA